MIEIVLELMQKLLHTDLFPIIILYNILLYNFHMNIIKWYMH